MRMWHCELADPLFNLFRQEGADHGEDRPENQRLVKQVDSSNFEWEGVLDTQHISTCYHEQHLPVCLSVYVA